MELTFLEFTRNGQTRCATPKMIEEVAKLEGKTSEELLVILAGTWRTVVVKEEFLHGDRLAIERKITVLKDDKFVRDPLVYPAVFAAQMVQSWTFVDRQGNPIPVSVEGYNRLPESIAQVVSATLEQQLDPLSMTNDDFFGLSGDKQTVS